MTGTQLLDAAIGVIFVVLSFSLVASALAEALATILNWRGRMLRRGLFRLLESSAELVDLPFPGRKRLAEARLTEDVLGDPSLRVLFGPRGAIARLWDRLANGRRSLPERQAAQLGRLPSAIPAEGFARALVDQLVGRVDLGAEEPESPKDLVSLRALIDRVRAAAVAASEKSVQGIPLAPELRTKLIDVVGQLALVREMRARLGGFSVMQADLAAELDGIAREAEARLTGVLSELESWFDRAMERVSGWYQRRTRLVLFLLGVGLAASANLNLFDLGERVLSDGKLRAALIEQAHAVPLGDAIAPEHAPLPVRRPGAGTDPAEAVETTLATPSDTLTSLPGYGGAGLGWNCSQGQATWACLRQSLRFSSFLSWFLIGLGCMMGGQFWYDVLGAVLRFRPIAKRAR